MPHSIADDFKSIPMSSNLGESLERAHRFAREQAHRTVTLEHLLLALTEDQEAALILEAANVDLGRLRADVSGHLGRLLEDMRAEPGSEPRPDPELLRVLQAAASAAQQSKRRQIDGAIVLAAVVGDGKSPAAGTLKSHGMTFEEAIRALQRANSQARLKMPAKITAAAKAPEPVAAVTPEPPKPAGLAAAIEVPSAASDIGSLSARLASHADTADHILAAARLRIQQRAAAAAAHLKGEATPTPAATREPAAKAEAPVAVAEKPAAPARPPGGEGSNSFQDLLAVSGAASGAATVAKTEPAPGPRPLPSEALPDPAARTPQQEWAPPRDMRPQGAPRPPQTPGGRAPPRGPRPDEAARQPQPPQRGARPGPGPGPAPGAPGVPARLPSRAEAGSRPAGMNGSMPAGPMVNGPAGGPVQAPRPGSARGAQGDRGPLVESVPRRMRVGVTSKAEVRIARARIESLVVALNGQSMPHRPDQIAARALTVRLKAPSSDFLIESVSPETQWVERTSGLGQDEYAIWRWAVTPQLRGKGRLLLMVSARTVGQDGLAAETAPPDRVIDVRVKRNRIGVRRLMSWLLAMAIGVAIGKFSNRLWDVAAALLHKMLSS
ncbi:MAG: Clp protease N-terminal domain-containing protein [Hyphomicrobiaceae bacterium]